MYLLRLITLLLGLVSLSTFASAGDYVGPINTITCNKVAVLETGSSGMQVVVPAVSGQTIFLCGWNVTNTGANGTIAFVYGTQTTTPCDTGVKKLSPTFNVSSNSPNQDHEQNATNSTSPSQAICANPSAATFSVLIWYAQF